MRVAERGFALLIVLWTLVLVTLIVTHVVTAARQETRLAENLRSAAELGEIADGGVQEAVFHLLDKSAGHWRADGAPHRSAGPSGALEIRIFSEAGKVNLNTAQVELLAALLRETGLERLKAEAIANAIVVWRTPKGEAPAMAAAYKQAGLGYAPPNAQFESVREVGHVLGVTPAILERIEPYLTVHHDGGTDGAAADPVVRQALKDVFGQVPTGGPSGPDEAFVDVRTTVTRGAAHAEREAIVRIGPTPKGRLYEILGWRGAP